MKSILFINPPNKLFNEQKSLESGLDQPGIPLGVKVKHLPDSQSSPDHDVYAASLVL